MGAQAKRSNELSYLMISSAYARKYAKLAPQLFKACLYLLFYTTLHSGLLAIGQMINN